MDPIIFSHPLHDLTSYYGKSALERNRMANRESKREKSHDATDTQPTLGPLKVVQGRSRDARFLDSRNSTGNELVPTPPS